jgi:hypothetical protein
MPERGKWEYNFKKRRLMGTTIFGMSKTSINGVLILLIAILTSVLAYQIPAALLTPGMSHDWLWITAACNLIVAILRAVVGFLQGDAPISAVGK